MKPIPPLDALMEENIQLISVALPWLLAVHVPIAFVVVLRVLSGLGWRLITFPVLIGAFFAGQFLGGQLYLWWRR